MAITCAYAVAPGVMFVNKVCKLERDQNKSANILCHQGKKRVCVSESDWQRQKAKKFRQRWHRVEVSGCKEQENRLRIFAARDNSKVDGRVA